MLWRSLNCVCSFDYIVRTSPPVCSSNIKKVKCVCVYVCLWVKKCWEDLLRKAARQRRQNAS